MFRPPVFTEVPLKIPCGIRRGTGRILSFPHRIARLGVQCHEKLVESPDCHDPPHLSAYFGTYPSEDLQPPVLKPFPQLYILFTHPGRTDRIALPGFYYG